MTSSSSRISKFLPISVHSELKREHISNWVDLAFRSFNVIWLEGPPESGRSVSLKEFALSHPESTIAIFLSREGSWGTDWELLRYDLYEQISAILGDTAHADEAQVTDAVLRSHIRRLIRLSRHQTTPIYFVIDGIESIAEERNFVRAFIIDVLPLGIDNFKFLLSGDEKNPHDWFKVKGGQKILPAMPFTVTEARQFLGESLSDDDLMSEIYATSKGHPGNLASIKRLLEGKSVESQRALVERLPEELPQLFEIEWNNQPCTVQWRDFSLSIIAIEKKALTANLASYLDVPRDELIQELKRISFLQFSDTNDTVSYVSDAFRTYAENRLRALHRETNDRIIENLLQRPDDEIAFNTLPGYLANAGRNEELLNYLTPIRVQQILEKSQSCAGLIKRSEMGIQGAQILKRDGELFRLSTVRAALLQLEQFDTWREEIEAHIALEDYDRAMALAESSRLKEHRLRMLAAFAHKLVAEKKDVPPEIVAQVRALYAGVEESSLKSFEVELASDLICVAPEIAIELIEKSRSQSEGKSRDLAFAHLSFVAFQDAKSANELETPSLAQSLRERIKDNSIKSLSEAAQVLVGDFSVDKVLAEIERLSGSNEKLFLVQNWLKFNKQNENAWRISEYGVQLAIKSIEKTPDAALFADLAEPISQCADDLQRASLITAFDAQKPHVERIGPSADYVRMQLALAAAEAKHDSPSSVQRVLECYFFAGALGDSSTRVLCFAHLREFLSGIKEPNPFEKEGLGNLLDKEIEKEVALLLAETADHYAALGPLLRRIAKYDPKSAYSYACRLNTTDRRNYAKEQVALSSIKKGSDAFAGVWVSVANDLANTPAGDELLLETVRTLWSMEAWEPEHLQIYQELERRAPQIANTDDRCCAICILLNMSERHPTGVPVAKVALLDILKQSWMSVDQSWLKLSVAYKIAGAIGKRERGFANALVADARGLAKQTQLSHRSLATVYIALLNLGIRAYGGLINASSNFERDIEKLASLITNIPSSGDQVNIWCEIALRCFMTRRRDHGEMIVNERVKPLLAAMNGLDRAFREEAIELAVPALFVCHQSSALEWLRSIPQHRRENAVHATITFIVRKVSPDEPYEATGRHTPVLTWEELLDLCTLAEEAECDWTIYRVIQLIADFVTSKNGKRKLTSNERSSILVRMREIVRQKVPTKHFTPHEGYRIICEAQLARISDDRAAYKRAIAETKAVPNLADRAHIYTVLASIVPDTGLARECAKEARAATAGIPVDKDRIEHYIFLAEELDGVSRATGNECLKKAMEEAFKSTKDGMENIQRRVIDLLHMYEPDKRDMLISFLDQDPARAEKKKVIDKKLKEIEARSKLADVDRLLEVDRIEEHHGEAAWRLLGGLNAHRAVTVTQNKVRQIIALASQLPLLKAYSILCWAVENLVRRNGDTPQAQQIIRPLFEAALATAELVFWMAGADEKLVPQNVSSLETGSLLIGSGDSSDAKEYIETWIKEENADYYIICDPYFTHEDLRVLLIFKAISPQCRIDVLTSRKVQKQAEGIASLEEQYRSFWRVNVSVDDPVDTRLIVAGLRQAQGAPPIHDRWILGRKTGLRIGTSINGLDALRLSELSRVEAGAVVQLRERLLGYIEGRIRFQGQDRIDYSIFSL